MGCAGAVERGEDVATLVNPLDGVGREEAVGAPVAPLESVAALGGEGVESGVKAGWLVEEREGKGGEGVGVVEGVAPSGGEGVGVPEEVKVGVEVEQVEGVGDGEVVGVAPQTGEAVGVAVFPPPPGVGVARAVESEDKLGVPVPEPSAVGVEGAEEDAVGLRVLRMAREGEGKDVMVFPPPPQPPLPSWPGEGVRDMEGVGLSVPRVEEEGVPEPSPLTVPPKKGVGVPLEEAEIEGLALLAPLPVAPPPPPMEGVGGVLGVLPPL